MTRGLVTKNGIVNDDVNNDVDHLRKGNRQC